MSLSENDHLSRSAARGYENYCANCVHKFAGWNCDALQSERKSSYPCLTARPILGLHDCSMYEPTWEQD